LFPHNEDEVAQSEAATHHPFVRYWMHNGSVLVGGEKMSKSKGNFTTIADAIEKYGATLLRCYVVSSHYGSPTDYSHAAMQHARSAWERIQLADQNAGRILLLPRRSDDEGRTTTDESQRLEVEAHEQRTAFFAAMDDDFNTPSALAAVFELTKAINRFIS